MRDKKILTLPVIILIIVIPFVIGPIWSALTGHSVTDVQDKIEDYLYEKYGEEFVVDRIGTRSSRGEEFYQARIYPKSIIGTNREGDDYYYASASVGIESFGRLGRAGDSYGLTKINIGAEEYLLPKIKEIFGNRVMLKPDVKYKIRNSHDFYEWNKEPNFTKALNEVRKTPRSKRIELDLEVYIFDRINNEEEKEERRKDIFDCLQYLKEEGLFEYLEMRVFFIDERVLAPGYDKFKRDIYFSRKVKKYIKEENITVELPPKNLRIRMSETLNKDINNTEKNVLIKNMRKLKKYELSYDGILKSHSHYISFIYSKDMIKIRYPNSIEKKPDLLRDYNDIKDIELGPNLEYIYID